MDATAGIIIVTALLVGLVAGWLLSSRAAAPLKSECNELRQRCGSAESGSAAAEERAKAVDQLRPMLTSVTGERDEALREVERLRTGAAEREKGLEARIVELGAIGENLIAQFKEVSAQTLEGAQKTFLERADARFNQAGEKHEEKLKSLLQPVNTSLQDYKDQVARIEKARTEAYGNISAQLDRMRTDQEKVASETARLSYALRGNPKTPGDWGQHHFRNLIELAGLSARIDFDAEKSFESVDGRVRPDFVINLPEEGRVVVDIKCSLNSYLNAASEPDPDLRKAHLIAHAKAVNTHAEALARKAYFEDVAGSPEFVIMYIPGDHYFAAAMEADPKLWNRAAERRVIIACPATFVPLAHSLAAIWKSYKLNEDAGEIARIARQLYDRMCTMTEHVRLVGRGLASAVDNYNDFIGSLEGSVLPNARKFKKLGVGSGDREIPELITLDMPVREPKQGRDLLFAPANAAVEAVETPSLREEVKPSP